MTGVLRFHIGADARRSYRSSLWLWAASRRIIGHLASTCLNCRRIDAVPTLDKAGFIQISIRHRSTTLGRTERSDISEKSAIARRHLETDTQAQIEPADSAVTAVYYTDSLLASCGHEPSEIIQEAACPSRKH